jgi:hypothetical protein
MSCRGLQHGFRDALAQLASVFLAEGSTAPIAKPWCLLLPGPNLKQEQRRSNKAELQQTCLLVEPGCSNESYGERGGGRLDEYNGRSLDDCIENGMASWHQQTNRYLLE